MSTSSYFSTRRRSWIPAWPIRQGVLLLVKGEYFRIHGRLPVSFSAGSTSNRRADFCFHCDDSPCKQGWHVRQGRRHHSVQSSPTSSISTHPVGISRPPPPAPMSPRAVQSISVTVLAMRNVARSSCTIDATSQPVSARRVCVIEGGK